MNDLPINQNSTVTFVTPKAISQLNKIKEIKNEKPTENPKAINDSLDGLSAAMQAKVQLDNQDKDYIKNKREYLTKMVLYNMQMRGCDLDSIQEDEINDIVDGLMEDESLDIELKKRGYRTI